MNPHHYAKQRAKDLTRQNGEPYAVNLARVLREEAAAASGGVSSAGPYSTGGGGTVLEHRFGAVLLSHLLTRRPVPALGDHVAPTHIRFQGRNISKVDDILVRGRSATGAEHLLSVGVRRQPRLVPSEVDSVQLIRAYLDLVVGDWPLLQSGRQRLALAVVPACQPAHQLAALAGVAAAEPTPAEFRRRMAAGGGYANKGVRGRLAQLDALVAAALRSGLAGGAVCSPDVLTWRLLSKLSLIELRLEGADLSDRTEAVARLQQLTPEGLPSEADALFSRLAELVGIYAPEGAEVSLSSLTADLHGLACFAPLSRPKAAVGEAKFTGVPQQMKSQEARVRTGARRQQFTLWRAPTVSGKALQPVLEGETLVVRDGYWLVGFDKTIGERLWALQTAFEALPVTGSGQVFVADRSGRVVPIDARTGRKGRPLPVHMIDGSAVVDRGTLFTAAPDAHIHALDLASRVLLWTGPVGGRPAGPPRVCAGRVFLQTCNRSNSDDGTTMDGDLWAFRADGSLQMYAAQEGELLHWAVDGSNVYVVSRSQPGQGRITALDSDSGRMRWHHAFDGDLAGKPALTRRSVYLTTTSGDVVALASDTGRELWRMEAGVRAAAAARVCDGVVYLGLWQPRQFLALDSGSGAQLWRRRTSGSFVSAPFTASGVVYAGHRGGLTHGWNTRSGKEVRRVEVMWDEARQGSPLVADGTAYVTGSRGELLALSVHVT
ncbi:PQQ-binding-like beta-propeller repeat protein [Streptomyces pratensis]|uniref:outer membrane protein assembly factor BamB family protein n=1 Tax=Streptomyces pratensis TaxID=1169025 RepID=UPI003799F8B1